MNPPPTQRPLLHLSTQSRQKPRTFPMTNEADETLNPQPESESPELEATPAAASSEIEDPIGDTTDGEAKASAEAEGESEIEAEDNSELEDNPESEDASESESKPRPPAKLERLQKILAAAGVSSRRSAEAMIEQGRVQVNGKVVTTLGTKADAGRDHIRVDGKLLQGAERHRYFVLNKPKGFVTTVKDPEGRPTVMQFFEKMKERLYPVGRLDYMSEGLLVVTNDGELANRLTKAASGVEKTYLVKVAGIPTEAELDILRAGVAIEKGKPGSGKVRTSPARIRQVRQGDNPWYEVVLIEGRNRELRKMFEEVGHFVEKIRRVGYGPLVLDQEPGNLRELEPSEVDALRLAAEGKLRTPKSKELRRRNAMDAAMLPTVLPKPSGRPRTSKPADEFAAAPQRTGEFRPKKFGADRPVRTSRPASSFASGEANKFFRPARPSTEGFRPAADRTPERGPARTDERPRRATGAGPAKFGAARPAGRPAWKKDDRTTRPPARFAAGSTGESRPGADRPFAAKPAWKKPEQRDARPGRPERDARPEYKRPTAPRREAPAREARVFDEDLGPIRPPNLHIEEITGSERSSAPRSSTTRPGAPRSSYSRPSASRPSTPRPYADRPAPSRPYSDRPRPSRPTFERPASSDRSSTARPFRSEGGLPRPFTTSSGKPRAGGARPSSKPLRPGSSPRGGSDSRPSYGGKRPYGTTLAGRSSTSPRPYTPRTEGVSDYRPTKAKPYPSSASRAERKAGPGWKPKPSFGGPGKPASGSRAGSRPGGSKPGGFSKSGYKARPGGAKRTGPRPGGKPGGKKRG